MNTYETIIVLKGSLTEEKVKEKEFKYFHTIVHGVHLEDDDIKTYVHKVENLGKKKLAYEITRKDVIYKEGYYLTFTYQTASHLRIDQLEEYINKDDNVLKSITVKLDDKNGIDLDHPISEQDYMRNSSLNLNSNPKIIDAFDLIFGEI